MKFAIEESRLNRIWILDENISEQNAHNLKLLFNTYYGGAKELEMFRVLIRINFNNSFYRNRYTLRKAFIKYVSGEVSKRLKDII